jgi:hypothetical protein
MEHLILSHQLVHLRFNLLTQTHRLIRLKSLLLALQLLQVVVRLGVHDALSFDLPTDLVQLVLLIVYLFFSLVDLSLHVGIVSL